MKRFIISALCAASAVISGLAQDMFDSGDNNARFGVRVAWDLTSPANNIGKFTDEETGIVSNADLFSNGSGFSIGGFYDIPLWKNLYFEPGLSLYYNTFGINEIVGLDDMDMPLTIDGSVRNLGFRIPLLAGYRFDFTEDISMSFLTGPQLNIGLNCKMHINARNNVVSVSKSTSLYEGDGLHRLDLQWMFGVRFHYADNWFADLTGGIGMTNLINDKDADGMHLRRNTFSIGVGYLF